MFVALKIALTLLSTHNVIFFNEEETKNIFSITIKYAPYCPPVNISEIQKTIKTAQLNQVIQKHVCEDSQQGPGFSTLRRLLNLTVKITNTLIFFWFQQN